MRQVKNSYLDKFILSKLKFLPFVLLGLTPILWFWGRGSALINGVDTNFPLDPKLWLSKRFFVWNDDLNAGVDFSSSVAGIFFHFIQVIPQILGANLQGVEAFSLLFWFAAIVCTSFYFACTVFGKRFIAIVVFVVLYSFNIYLFNTWENVKVANISLIASIPLGLAILQRLKDKRFTYRSSILIIILCGLLLSGSGINPAYFLCFLFVVLLYYLGLLVSCLQWKEVKERTKDLSFFLCLLIIVNLFWILPTGGFILQNVRSERSIDAAGYTNWLDSLSENTSILNVMRVQGAWDWYAYDSVTGLPYYIPYSLNYFHKIPFLAFSFLLPVLLIVSLVFQEKKLKNFYFPFALMFVLGIFLGAGTHLPTGDIYRVLANKVPFFSLFRSPWYIFTPLVIIAVAGLVSMLFIRLERSEYKGFKFKYTIWFFVVILTVGNLFYNYPLVTGRIFRPGRDDTFYINFPKHVFETKQWLDQRGEERILTYPDDEIEKFTWKYRGVESILQLATDKEFIFSPLNSPDAPTPRIARELYLMIKKGELTAAQSLASKLSVTALFEKGDQPSLSFQLPEGVKEKLLARFADWSFYKFPSGNTNKKIFVSDLIYVNNQDQDVYPKVMSVLDSDILLTNEKDRVLKSRLGKNNLLGFALKSTNLQEREAQEFVLGKSILSNRLTQRNPSTVTFEIDIPSRGYYKPALETYRLEDFGISPNEDLHLKHNSQETVWVAERSDDSFVYYSPVLLESGLNRFSITIQNRNLVGRAKVLGDFHQEGLGEFKVLGEETDAYLEILNRDTQDTSAVFPVNLFNPLQTYVVQLKYRQIYGNNASVLVGQNNSSTLIKVNVERLPNYPEWNYFSFYYQPVTTDSVMKVALVAPQTPDPLGTKISYGDLQVYKVFTNSLVFLEEKPLIRDTSTTNFKKLSPVLYKGKVEDVRGPHFLVFDENYSPGWQLTIISPDGKRRVVDNDHISANLFANAWYVTQSGQDYEFEIYYKPQNLLIVGAWGSATGIASLLLLNLSRKRTKT